MKNYLAEFLKETRSVHKSNQLTIQKDFDQMLYLNLRIASVYSVVVVSTPTAPQILTALTENSTLVSGMRSGRTYIFLALFTVVLVPSYVNLIS